jgi:cation diffusion facilitator CzcD-associated flavoprotein CzcO
VAGAPQRGAALSVAIIGAGFGGLGMAIQLARAGFHDVTIFERAEDVGGTWLANTYPGAACDIPSHLYSFSFAPKTDWTRRYPPQQEILDYLRDCARRFDLARRIRFGVEVTAADFDEATGRWTLTMAGGETHEADVLVTACGQLSRPTVPDLPGLDSFAGTTFHSAQWRHDHDLADRRVAVVGTGASAIQFVPQIVPRVRQLSLFQRHAPHVIRKPDRPYGPKARAAFRRFPVLQRLSRIATYLNYESRALGFVHFPALTAWINVGARRHLREQVSDPGLRERLRPEGTPGCRRVLLADDYYPALTRPHVDVVTEPITEVRPHAVVTADGAEHEVDTIIFGTGFTATDFLAPMEITGLGGRKLDEAWRDGAEAHLGISITGFPNLFMLYGPNTNLGHNSIIYMLESQFRYVLGCVRRLADPGLRWMDVRPETQAGFVRWVRRRMRSTVWDRDCTSWYRTASGRNTNNWPGFTFGYRFRTRAPRRADYRLQPAEAPG